MRPAALLLALAPSLCAAALTPGLYRYDEAVHHAGATEPTGMRRSECVTAEDIASGAGLVAPRRSCRVENKVASGQELGFTMECDGTVERVAGRIGDDSFFFTTVVVGARKGAIAAREIRGRRVASCP